MLKNLREFIKNFEKGLPVRQEFPKDYQKIKNIVTAGMGASSTPAQIVKDSLASRVPIEISRSYTLPPYANRDTLLVCISCSGNTRETLSQFEQGINRKCKILTITSGGELERKAKKINIPQVKIPKGLLSRESLPFLLFALIKVLEILNLAKAPLPFKVLKEEQKKIEKEAKIFAKKIKKTFPIICSEHPSASFRWESQFSENSKFLSESKSLPELCHNEIESWKSLNKKHSVIFLRDKKESKEIGILIRGIKKIIKNKSQILEVYGKGENKLERILYLILFGDFVSYFLAKEKKINPKRTEYIKMLKDEIKKAKEA